MHSQNGPSLLSRLTSRARENRKTPTPSEARLWQALRMRRAGVRFCRQYPLCPYVVDFYCRSRKLVVEVDGGYHGDPAQRALDQHRDAELVRLHGVRIVRVDAELVMRSVAHAVALVLAAL